MQPQEHWLSVDSAQEGGTLTAVISDISDADGNLSFAYQWQSSSDNSSWSDIGGATGDTYTIADNQSMVGSIHHGFYRFSGGNNVHPQVHK
jgi:hypothetical protein